MLIVISQVTGASGFLGSHIVLQLLDNGYTVRAYEHSFCLYILLTCLTRSLSAARSQKLDDLHRIYARFGDKFATVPVVNIVTDDFSEALKGADALIHSATPLPHRNSREDVVKVSQLCIGETFSKFRAFRKRLRER